MVMKTNWEAEVRTQEKSRSGEVILDLETLLYTLGDLLLQPQRSGY